MVLISVTLVRHGQTIKNHEKKIQSRTDSLLSELGELQCDQLGKYLTKEKFTHVYASDLTRAQQTAKHILKHNENLPIPVIMIDSRIRERDFGDWEGTDVQEVYERALKLGTRMHRLSVPRGESFTEFSQKALDFFLEICQLTETQHEGNGCDDDETNCHVLIASHGGWILTLFDSLQAYPEKFKLENYEVDESIRSPLNSSFTKLSVSRDTINGKFLVKFHTIFNISHLQ